MQLWEQVVDVMCPMAPKKPKINGSKVPFVSDCLGNVDFVPPNLPEPNGRVGLLILEDNDAVIKMCLKGRSPALRHVGRTHRVDLDWLFERLREDLSVNMRYIHTSIQGADILIKGQFTGDQWNTLCRVIQVAYPKQRQRSKVRSNQFFLSAWRFIVIRSHTAGRRVRGS